MDQWKISACADFLKESIPAVSGWSIVRPIIEFYDTQNRKSVSTAENKIEMFCGYSIESFLPIFGRQSFLGRKNISHSDFSKYKCLIFHRQLEHSIKRPLSCCEKEVSFNVKGARFRFKQIN